MLLSVRFVRVRLVIQATTFDLIKRLFTLNDFKCENNISSCPYSKGLSAQIFVTLLTNNIDGKLEESLCFCNCSLWMDP